MIVIEKESPDMFKSTRVYERCIFCNAETNTWHTESNNPICALCSKTNSIDLHENLYGQMVQMNDRFESVHLWTPELAKRNAGKYTPIATGL